MRSLKERVPSEDLRRAHRLEFHQLICITRGSCCHVIDFTPIHCRPGSILVHQPSQTEQYDVSSHWDGWLVLFRPEFLFMPAAGASAGTLSELNLVGLLAALPQHLELPEPEFHLVRTVLSQMHADSQLDAPKQEVHSLLRHQLCALLIRLSMAQRHEHGLRPTAPAELHRFRRFQQLVEQHFRSWQKVSLYASALGYSEKTLGRATISVTGLSAKTFIASRVTLEAKRMLVHTSLPIAAIGDDLGFDDPSNFVKFFKRESGCTPLRFRTSHRRTAGRI